MNFSSSEENYLKAIYHLQSENGKVSTSALAAELSTKASSITDMMKKLSAKKLLHYKPYHGFSLSEMGKKAALLIIRRHRLWEYFLSEKLKFSWNEVHSIADELEHVRNKKLVEKLDAYLGYPEFDPHGDPIPDSRGKMKKRGRITLLQLPLNEPAAVCRVTNQSEEMLEQLEHKNISIGTVVEIKKHFPFDRSYELKIRPNITATISEQLAKNIFVTYEA